MKYGLQMYSVRDTAKEDLRLAISEVAKMGYTSVEFAGLYDNSAESVAAWLSESGIEAVGTHTRLDALTDGNISETIRIHKMIGASNLTVPGADWSTEELMRSNIELLNKAAPILAEEGIRLGYHNHSREFYKTSYGKIVFDEIIARTSIDLEVDTFWLYNAGIDPVPYLEEHKDRIRLIHLKDGRVDRSLQHSFEDPHSGAVGLAVGEGEVPVADIVSFAKNNGIGIVVESEGLDPTGLEEVRRCIVNLKKLEEK